MATISPRFERFQKIAKSHCFVLALLLPLACQGFQSSWPSEHAQYEFDPSPGVEYEICVPTRHLEIRSLDVDISDYLKALDESISKATSPGSSKLRRYLPDMSTPRHMAIRYADSTTPIVEKFDEMKESEDGVVKSEISGGKSLRDVTASGQAVFYDEASRFRDLVAIAIRLRDPNYQPANDPPYNPFPGWKEYWFKSPSENKIPTSNFTAWIAPVSAGPGFSADSPIRWKKGDHFGRGFPISGDARALPKIRYRLIDMSEQVMIDYAWHGLAAWLPGLIDKQYDIKIKGDLNTFIRPADPIPSCD